MWSSPLITCVIDIDASSTTTAKLYAGIPSARTITGSPITSVWNLTEPRTASSNTISRASGTLNRRAGRSPVAIRARASATDKSRQRPE